MKKLEYFTRFYLDKEKDILVNLFKPAGSEEIEELTYVIETPNHSTGNLITNLAKLCGVKTIKNESDMKVIKGALSACLNGDNKEVFIFRLRRNKNSKHLHNRQSRNKSQNSSNHQNTYVANKKLHNSNKQNNSKIIYI